VYSSILLRRLLPQHGVRDYRLGLRSICVDEPHFGSENRATLRVYSNRSCSHTGSLDSCATDADCHRQTIIIAVPEKRGTCKSRRSGGPLIVAIPSVRSFVPQIRCSNDGFPCFTFMPGDRQPTVRRRVPDWPAHSHPQNMPSILDHRAVNRNRLPGQPGPDRNRNDFPTQRAFTRSMCPSIDFAPPHGRRPLTMMTMFHAP